MLRDVRFCMPSIHFSNKKNYMDLQPAGQNMHRHPAPASWLLALAAGDGAGAGAGAS
jgi:hypothetical protein